LPSGSPRKIALHALAGGAVAEATGGDFRTGALAAGANEALVDHLAELVNDDPQLLVAASQITGIVAAELTDGDVNQGAEIAGYSTQYNYLSHQQLTEAKEELAACAEGDDACMADVVERYQALSQQQDAAAYEACSTDLAACQEHSLAANSGESAPHVDDALWDLSPEARPYLQTLFDENIGVQNTLAEASIARNLREGTELSPETAAVLAALPVGYNRKATSSRTAQVVGGEAALNRPDYLGDFLV
ncbi:hypothetical protein, partial [Litchfieldella qijiaojingensis]|uniref:hypothetical protein n=1 Tax=Litchfieldella qijiaojingensis TaxID=980347 RepID=UPI0016737679